MYFLGRLVNKNRIIFQLLSTGILFILQFIQLKFLTDSLSVSDFGGYAISVVFFNVFIILGDSGVGSFFIHKQKKYISVMYFLWSLRNAFFCFLVLTLLIPLWNVVFSFSSFYMVLPFVLLSLPFFSLGSISQSILLVKERQLLVSTIDIASKILSTILLISLIDELGLYAAGLSYSSYWLFRSLFLLFFTRSSFKKSKDLDNDFRNYSGSLISSQILGSLRYQADVLVVGVFFGSHITGIYSLAKQLVNIPSQLTNPILQRIVLPYFSKFQSSSVKLDFAVKQIGFYLIGFSGLIFIFIFLYSDFILNFIGGEEYLEASYILSVMAATFFLRLSFGGLQSSLAQSLGRTDIELRWSLIVTPVLILSLLFGGAFLSVDTFVILQLVIQLLISFLSLYLCLKKMIPFLIVYEFIFRMAFSFLLAMLASLFSYFIVNYFNLEGLFEIVAYWVIVLVSIFPLIFLKKGV